MKQYVADFETVTDHWSLKHPQEKQGKPLNARVWLWGVMGLDETESMNHGTSIDTFIDFLHATLLNTTFTT